MVRMEWVNKQDRKSFLKEPMTYKIYIDTIFLCVKEDKV